MKNLFLFLFALHTSAVFSQTESFETLFYKGKQEFQKDFDQQNYDSAVYYLEKAVSLAPENAEAHYFLAYAYSRKNSKDGNSMIYLSKELLFKASNELETTIKLSPKYESELIVLDPYSKLTAEWGSLAISYLYKNKPDSAIWAFREGKKRGGFSKMYLELAKTALDFCEQNAILISSGDNITFPLAYLQTVENYRPDVDVADIGLLNANWYPTFLQQKQNLDFGLPISILDTLQYCTWKDSLIQLQGKNQIGFEWILKPSYYNSYLLRGDRILFNLFKQNNLNRSFYFTSSFPEESQVSLADFFESHVVVERVNFDNRNSPSLKEYLADLKKVIKSFKYMNTNCLEEEIHVDIIRYSVLNKINKLIELDKKEEANDLMNWLEKNLSLKKYPMKLESLPNYFDYIKGKIKL